MALKLIVGPAGSGKTHRLMTTIIEESQTHPGKTYIVVVPEQFSMQTQDILTACHPGGAILNIDVLSFARLAYRVFDEVGFDRYEILEEIGKTFVLQKAALDKEGAMPFLGSRLKKAGCLADMKSVISELVQYDISPEQIQVLADASDDNFFKTKMNDIGTVYRAYREYLGDRMMTAEEVPDKLAEIAEQSQLLKGAVIAFDCFTGFTPIQLKLIRKMLPLAESVYCTVTCDDRAVDAKRSAEDDLFHMSETMIRTLTALAHDTETPVDRFVRLTGGTETRFGHTPALSHLEKHIFRSKKAVYDEVPEGLALHVYNNTAAEAEGTARLIASLVREKGYRYRDMAVICGDVSGFAGAIRRAFRDEGIPFFIDEKRTLLNNPFVEAIRSAVEACVNNYAYDAVFRLLKTGMTDLSDDAVARLENYVLARGIRGKGVWRKEWLYQGPDEDETSLLHINESRRYVISLLDPLSEALAGRRETVRTATEALYRFCLTLRFQEKLEGRRVFFEDKGRIDLAREYAQIYSKVMMILDRLVNVLGNEKIPMSDYQALIEAGLAEIRIGIIPPGIDQVTIGNVERTRLKDVKVLFFIGVQEGLIPKAAPEGGFITEVDREYLTDGGLTLRPSEREAVYIQNFYLYLALTKPSDRLILSYAASDSAGKSVRPSYLISQITRLYPKLPIQIEKEKKIGFVERPSDGRSLLTEPLRHLKDTDPDAAWYELYAWYRRHPEAAQGIDRLFDGVAYRKAPDSISRAAARMLYGRVLKNSATRLEQFAACPYAHFAGHGLHLAKRREYEFNGMDRGTIIHDALERFGRKTEAAGLKWTDLDDKTRDALADDCLREAAKGHVFLEENARNAYETERLRRFMRMTLWAMQKQVAAGDFRPGSLEKVFGDEAESNQVIELPDGSRMILKGRIDRIDICDDGDDRYVKVVDYKTGYKTFDLTELVYGLQLQLPLYMDAALRMAEEEGKTVIPAALLYHVVDSPMLEYDEGRTEEERERNLLKAMRDNGFVSSEPTVFRHLDRELSPSSSSLYIPLSLDKNGNPSSRGSKAGDTTDFLIMSRYAVLKAARIGTAIMDGEVSVKPYRMKQKNACRYCDFRDVCGFDEQFDGCDYQELKPLNMAEAFDYMKDMLQETTDEMDD